MRRTNMLRVPLTTDERERLDREATRNHLPTATWARALLLGTASRAHDDTVHFARRGVLLCGLPLSGQLHTGDASEVTCPDCRFAMGQREG